MNPTNHSIAYATRTEKTIKAVVDTYSFEYRYHRPKGMEPQIATIEHHLTNQTKTLKIPSRGNS
jgi:hypothetical protein